MYIYTLICKDGSARSCYTAWPVFCTRFAAEHWPPFYVHRKLCKNDTPPSTGKFGSHGTETNFECLLKIGFYQLAKSIVIVLELIYIKMEVSVSEPCDVIMVKSCRPTHKYTLVCTHGNTKSCTHRSTLVCTHENTKSCTHIYIYTHHSLYTREHYVMYILYTYIL